MGDVLASCDLLLRGFSAELRIVFMELLVRTVQFKGEIGSLF